MESAIYLILSSLLLHPLKTGRTTVSSTLLGQWSEPFKAAKDGRVVLIFG